LKSGQSKKLIKLKVPAEEVSKITSLTPTPAAGAPPKVATKKRKPGADGGSGSGEDTTGEMSDGPNGTKKRIKIVSKGRALSPSAGGASPASRQGSPVPANAGSRAGSPAVPAGRAGSPPTSGPTGPITDEELLPLLGPEGTPVAAIASKFRQRVSDPANKGALVASLKRLTITKNGLLFRKEGV